MEERLNPELRSMFSAMPEMHYNDLETVRGSISEMLRESPVNESVSISDRYIPGPENTLDLRVRIYQPKEKTEGIPGLLWVHGGGYIIGVPEKNDYICQRFVLDINCVVVSVDYRLSPEHPFPAPAEDCYAGLKWFSEHSAELGVDPTRIGVAGQSAGGGLTASVSLMARDRNGPPIAFQMPLYPMIDNRNITPSSHEITDPRVWNRESNILGWRAYLGENHTGEVSPYAAPALAADFSGLPPTYTCVGDLDPFRDETIEYVAKLSQAGVPTEFHLYPGCFHGFEDLVPQAEISQRAEAQYVEAFKRAVQKVTMIQK
ncbi:alpha/beta hydrolase [Fictibacillus sp. NRS-1165]